MTTSAHDQLKDLKEIRSLMERSSRFIGLSGLSGVAAGVCALVGATVAYMYLGVQPFEYNHQYTYYIEAVTSTKWGLDYRAFFVGDALLTAAAAVALGIYFTTRRARKKGQSIWDSSAQRLLFNLGLPLFAGGLFCLALLVHGQLAFVAPATLVFYGLALVNGSKYTLNDVLYLGITEIALGLIAMFMLRFGMEFWVIGFGFLHIFYGLMMYFKYERNDN
jgi:uncharacterized membrane protein YgdD (TMEM256/DUF423 family)